MTGLKLAKLPDRTPVKLTIMMSPDLHNTLTEYARAYAESYGEEVPIADLAPAIVQAFLDGDRAFARARISRSPK